jgi:hypothetical protein
MRAAAGRNIANARQFKRWKSGNIKEKRRGYQAASTSPDEAGRDDESGPSKAISKDGEQKGLSSPKTMEGQLSRKLALKDKSGCAYAAEFIHPHKKHILNTLGFALFYVVGCLFYSYTEGWNILDCTYFITATVTSVGYGDFHPTTNAGYIFTIFYVIVGIGFIFTYLTQVAGDLLVMAEDSADKSLMNADYDPNRMRHRNRVRIAISLLAIIAMLMIGTIIFSQLEGWSILESAYFCAVTTTSTGYGDFSAGGEAGKIAAIFYMIISVTLVTMAFGNFTSMEMSIQREKRKQVQPLILSYLHIYHIYVSSLFASLHEIDS